jgi:hypothetical protein
MHRMLHLAGKELDKNVTQFFVEERFRRSFSITGYIVSGGGAGAISCWFAIGDLYRTNAPVAVLHALVVASGLLLGAVVLGFLAALAGYKAFETASSLHAEEFNSPYNRADQWVTTTSITRIIAVIFVTLGGVCALTAYIELVWR